MRKPRFYAVRVLRDGEPEWAVLDRQANPDPDSPLARCEDEHDADLVVLALNAAPLS